MEYQAVGSKDLARSLILKLVARAEELRKKPKLTPAEMVELKRLRMLARSIKV